MARWRLRYSKTRHDSPGKRQSCPLPEPTERYSKMLGHELHCVWDAREIPEDRARKGAITCSDECRRQYANYRRRVRAQGKCRLCGRGRRRTLKLDPVLMEHSDVYGTLGTQ